MASAVTSAGTSWKYRTSSSSSRREGRAPASTSPARLALAGDRPPLPAGLAGARDHPVDEHEQLDLHPLADQGRGEPPIDWATTTSGDAVADRATTASA